MVNSSSQHAPADLSERHRQILDEAMALIAERGLKAASLRELARRVSMSQPSLYHYFDSKEDLVGQIIANYSASTIASARVTAHVDTLEELLTTCLLFIRDLYQTSQHVTWVRFLFAVTMERPEFGGVLRDSFIERGMELAQKLAGPAIDAGQIVADDVRPALELAAGALTMRLLERRVMRTARVTERDDTEAFIAFTIDTVAQGVAARATATDAPKT